MNYFNINWNTPICRSQYWARIGIQMAVMVLAIVGVFFIDRVDSQAVSVVIILLALPTLIWALVYSWSVLLNRAWDAGFSSVSRKWLVAVIVLAGADPTGLVTLAIFIYLGSVGSKPAHDDSPFPDGYEQPTSPEVGSAQAPYLGE